MLWMKPTKWLASLCRLVAAQRFWVSLLLAAVGALLWHGVWRYVATLTLAQEQTLWVVLGIAVTWLVYALQWLWPLLMVLVGAWGAWQRWRGSRVFRRIQGRSKDGFEDITWQDFEVLVAELFRRHGFEVSLQGGDHPDGGIDAIVKRDGGVYLVQCKHWKAQRVGVKVVRELYGVVAAEGMDGGYVVTSGHFTPDAVDFAQGIAMQLINGRQLTALLDGELEL